MDKGNAMVSPFWHVGKSEDKTIVNMKVVTIEVKTVSTLKSQAMQHEVKVNIEVLVNTKVVNEGDELYLLADKADPNKKQRQQ